MLFKYIASLLEASLSKFSQQELIAMMLKLQNKMKTSDTKFAEEVRKLNESVQQLKSDLAVTKNVNSQLHNRFANMERQCQANSQYFWREYVEIVGIPTLVLDNELKKSFGKLSTRLELKLMIRILNPASVLAVKAVQ